MPQGGDAGDDGAVGGGYNRIRFDTRGSAAAGAGLRAMRAQVRSRDDISVAQTDRVA